MKNQKNSEPFLLTLDPRMKLLMVIFLTTTTYISKDLFTLAWNYFIIVMLYVFSGLMKNAVKTAWILGIMLVIEVILRSISETPLISTLKFIAFMIERMLVFFVMSGWMSNTIKITDLITALQNMHVPKGLTITLAVVFRYLPTVSEEFSAIKKTMRLRNVEPSFVNIIRNPVKMCEYSIVPMIIRSLKIADELSASAMTRGLDLERDRTSYKEVCLKFSDIIIFIVFVAIIFAGMKLDTLI